jgi:Protein of unknown function (DUF1572)
LAIVRVLTDFGFGIQQETGLVEGHPAPYRSFSAKYQTRLTAPLEGGKWFMAHQFTTSFLKDATELFRTYKNLGDRAMAQCPDAGLFVALDAESNSIAIIVKHLAGNMRSRWTDFLTTDGENPIATATRNLNNRRPHARSSWNYGSAAGNMSSRRWNRSPGRTWDGP